MLGISWCCAVVPKGDETGVRQRSRLGRIARVRAGPIAATRLKDKVYAPDRAQPAVAIEGAVANDVVTSPSFG